MLQFSIIPYVFQQKDIYLSLNFFRAPATKNIRNKKKIWMNTGNYRSIKKRLSMIRRWLDSLNRRESLYRRIVGRFSNIVSHVPAARLIP